MEFCAAANHRCIGKLTIMTREEMIEAIGAVTNPYRSRDTLYAIATELGLKIKKSNCKKCAKDAWNIIREELGMIASAAEESDFNGESDEGYVWVWNGGRAVSWNGHIMNADTPQEIIREYIKVGGDRFYHLEKNEENTNNQD